MVTAMIMARENRVMINSMKEDINEIKESIGKIANHYSRRLPIWATILLTLLASLVTGLIVNAVK